MMPVFYTAELDLADDDVDSFLHWFAYRHVPDLTRAGFPVSTCYRAVQGDMNLIDIYELPDVAVLQRPTYKGMGQRDTYAAPILEKRRDKSNTLYSQRAIAPDADGFDSLLDSDWVSIIRFDASEEVAGAIEDALRTEAPRLLGGGLSRIRFAQRGPDHPSYTSHRPRWLALGEAATRPSGDATMQFLLDAVPESALSNVKPFVGYRVYPWPDDAGLRA